MAEKADRCLRHSPTDPANMLTISHGHRRGFLKIGTAAFGGLTLANLLEARAASGGSFLRDRAVVVMNLQGGPTQFLSLIHI